MEKQRSYNETHTKMASHHPAIRRKTQQVATIAAGFTVLTAELLRVFAEGELRAVIAGAADTSAATATRLGDMFW
jgi:hypothetical protein